MPTPTNPTPDPTGFRFTIPETDDRGRVLRDVELVSVGWPIELLGETTGSIRSTPDGRLIETRPTPLAYRYPDLDPCTLAEAREAIEEAINAVWMMSAEHIMSDADASAAEDRFVALAHLIEYLATLLDGVLADDPQAIRDAAAWLTANRPEVSSEFRTLTDVKLESWGPADTGGDTVGVRWLGSVGEGER